MNYAQNKFSLTDSEASNLGQKPVPRVLDKQQKISLISLETFTVLVLVFAIFRFRYNLYSPFDYSKKLVSNQTISSINIVSTTTDLTKLDSDGDGLNDYDEINVYKTSPYLEDSDSDGFNDKEELLHNTDPNCPAGYNCAPISVDISSAISTPDDFSSSTVSGLTAEEQTARDMLSGKSDPAVLRKLLLDNGMDQANLDKISDDDLIASYQESLQNQAQAGAQ